MHESLLLILYEKMFFFGYSITHHKKKGERGVEILRKSESLWQKFKEY